MPFIAIATAFTVGLAVTFGATLTFSLVLTHFAFHAFNYLLSQAAKSRFDTITPEETGYEVSAVEPAAEMAVVYGRTKVGGIIVFKSVNDENGDETDDLKQVIVYAGHEIQSFDKFFFDEYELTLEGNKVTTDPFKDHAEIYTKLGARDQTAISELVSRVQEWTNNHRGRGRAYCYIDLKFDRDVYPLGEPRHRAILRGKKITDITKSTPVTEWTDNTALCLLDYLMDSEYGLGVPEDKIDKDMLKKAIDVCNEPVDVYAYGPNPKDTSSLYNITVTSGSNTINSSTANFSSAYVYVGLKLRITVGTNSQELTVASFVQDEDGSGYTSIETEENITLNGTATLVGFERRYTYNGSFTTDVAPTEVIDSLAKHMVGSVVFSQGKWRIKAGAYTDPVAHFTESDMVDTFAVNTSTSALDNYYYIGGTFKGPISEFIETDFTPVQNSTAYSDGNREKLDINFGFCNSPFRAQRMAKILLSRTLEPIQFEATFNMKAFPVSVGDVISITRSDVGWTNKTFEVLEWIFVTPNENGFNIKITAKEISKEAFNFNLSDQFDFNSNNTENSTDPYTVPDIGLTITSVYRNINGNEVPVIKANISCDSPSRIETIQLEQRLTSAQPDDPWTSMGNAPIEEEEIVIEGQGFIVGTSYDYRARGVNTLGVKGDWVTRTYTIQPDSRQPGNVKNFNYFVSDNNIVFSWDRVQIGNPQSYKIRVRFDNYSGMWSDSKLVLENIDANTTQAVVPAVAGFYMIKAQNSGGDQQSEDYASVSISQSDLKDYDNAIRTFENPDYNGQRNNTIVQGGDLTFEDYELNGNYFFSNVIDIGDVRNAWVHVRPLIDQEKYVPDPSEFDLVNVEGYVAVSQQEATSNETNYKPAGSDIVKPQVGDLEIDFTGTTFTTAGNLIGGKLTFGSGSTEQEYFIKRIVSDTSIELYSAIQDFTDEQIAAWDIIFSADNYDSYRRANGVLLTGRSFKFYVDLSSSTIGFKPDVRTLSSQIEYDDVLVKRAEHIKPKIISENARSEDGNKNGN